MVPPTSVWSKENYKCKRRQTSWKCFNLWKKTVKSSRNRIFKNSKIVRGKFRFAKHNQISWNAKLLEPINECCLFFPKWDRTYQGKRARLDPIFAKYKDGIMTMEHYLLGKSDHIVIKINYRLTEKITVNKERKGKGSYKRGDYRNLEEFFDGIRREH